jgi:hypothetical protein
MEREKFGRIKDKEVALYRSNVNLGNVTINELEVTDGVDVIIHTSLASYSGLALL